MVTEALVTAVFFSLTASETETTAARRRAAEEDEEGGKMQGRERQNLWAGAVDPRKEEPGSAKRALSEDLEEAAAAAVELRNKGCMNAAVVVAENAAAIFIAVFPSPSSKLLFLSDHETNWVE